MSDSAPPPVASLRRSAKTAWRLAGIVLGTFLTLSLVRLVSLPSPIPMLLWPAAALALAAGWRFGRGWIAAVALPTGLWTSWAMGSWAVGAAALVASVLGPLACLLLLDRLQTWKPAANRIEVVLRFIIGTGLVAAPIDALVDAGMMALMAGQDESAAATASFPALWLLDELGLLLVTPAMLALGATRPGKEPARPDAIALLLTAVLMLARILLDSRGLPAVGHLLVFLVFPVVAWSSVRRSGRSLTFTLVPCALMVLGTQGWLALRSDTLAALEGSMLMSCAVIVALLLQAVASDRRSALLRIARQAREDLSTGLLNDRGLLAELGERLATPMPGPLALISVHLSNFDTIHDLCGPVQAAQLERSTAASLRATPAHAQAARLSAGRYVLIAQATTLSEVRAIARDLYTRFNGHFFRTVNGSLRVQASCAGILIPAGLEVHAEDCLLSLADAMNIACSVREPQLFVEPLSKSGIDSRRAYQSRLEHVREAIRDERLEVHAQPIVDPEAPDGCVSFEVLTRLRDRDGTLIRPPEFLPLANQAQMMVALDRGVIRKVFEWLATHPDQLARTHKCSINLSGLTMSDGSIPAFVREQRQLWQIPAARIVFEITESEAIRNPAAASRLVDELKAQGFGIALDDFGTGLATFEYLKRFPLDYLKIDGSFIRNLVSNPIDEEIVMSTVRVARHLKVRTIAEHVHNRAIYDRLLEMGVECIQGELIGAPIPIADLFFGLEQELALASASAATDASRMPSTSPSAAAPSAIIEKSVS